MVGAAIRADSLKVHNAPIMVVHCLNWPVGQRLDDQFLNERTSP